MASGFVTIHSGGTHYLAPRGPHLHKNPGQTGDEHLFIPALTQESSVYSIYMYHSDDYGETWSRTLFVSDAAISNDATGSVVIDWDVADNVCHLAFLEASGNVFYAGFNLNTISVETAPQAVHTGFTLAAADHGLQIALVARDGATANGNGVVVQYTGPRFTSMGNSFHTAWYGRKTSGSWTTAQISPASTSSNFFPIATVRGSSGSAYFFYQLATSSLAGTPHSRSLSAGNSLGTAQTHFGLGNSQTKSRQSRFLNHLKDDAGTKYTFLGDLDTVKHSDRYNESSGVMAGPTRRVIVSEGGVAPAASARHDTDQLWAVGRTHPTVSGWSSDDGGVTWSETETFETSVPSFGELVTSTQTYQRGDNNAIVLAYVYQNGTNQFEFGDYVVASVGGVVDVGTIAEVDTLRSFEAWSLPPRVVICGNGRDDPFFDPIESHIYLASDDTLNNWERRPPTVDRRPYGAVYSPDRREYVIAGEFGNTLISPSNGKAWTLYTESGLNGWDLVWCPELDLYLMAHNTDVARSSDGITWTTTVVDDTQFTVGWSPELGLAAVGGGQGKIHYSSDGINWSAASSPNQGNNKQNVDNAWSPDLGVWVMTAWSGIIRYSTDGINWFEAAGNPYSDQPLRGVAWSQDLGIFVVAGRDGPSPFDTFTLISSDGVNWTKHFDSSIANTEMEFFRMEWVAESQLFIAVTRGPSSLTSHGAWTSPDGIVWTQVLTVASHISMRGIAVLPKPATKIGTIAEIDTLIDVDVVTPQQTVNVGRINEIDALINAGVQLDGGFTGWGIPI